jgi:phosphatidylglycerophosphate synthase
MHSVRRVTITAGFVQVAVLVALALQGLIGAPGVVAGALYGVLAAVLVVHARASTGRLGPADVVTWIRCCLVGGAVALVTGGSGGGATGALVVVATAALALDGVDGAVARRTGTASAFGARFDMEVDASLVLALGIGAARLVGPWVLVIGAARYFLLVAALAIPALDRPTPPRVWRKVVAAAQGVALMVVCTRLLPSSISGALAIAAAVALVWSFATQVLELLGHPVGRLPAWVLSAGAVLLVWAALVLPDAVAGFGPAAAARLPAEGVLIAALLLVVPRPVVRPIALALGLGLGVLTVAKGLNAAIGAALGRPFDPMSDIGQLGPGAGVVADALDTGPAVVLVCAVLIVVATLALLGWAVLRLAGLVRAVPRRTAPVLVAAAVVWAVVAATGVRISPGAPIASVDEAAFAAGEVGRSLASGAAVRSFGSALAKPDRYVTAPADLRLAKLRGMDVLVVFVESYGEVAVRGTPLSRGVDRTLAAGTLALSAAGFSARTAMLTSPTFGGISWLAHATLESGVWVPDQASYDRLLQTDHLTLARTFHDAGWRTVSDVPSDARPWPEGQRFYAFDRLYNADDVGYAGPRFSYARIPDQYTLARFGRLELARGHRPVMAEIDLVSSHTPWTPLPRLVPAASLGDGSVYDPMPAQGVPARIAWQDPKQVQALYGRSISYSIDSVVDFVAQAHDPRLVVLMVGDHQPAEEVSGPHASHDVPVSLIAADPGVLKAVGGWGWADGLLPSPSGPTWRMDRFRDRFLDAYSG